MRKVLYILGQLEDQDIQWMAQAGRSRMLNPDEVLIREKQETPDLYIVLEGRVDVHVEGVGRVAALGSGEILGEMSFVDKAPPSATVTAATPTMVLALNKARMEERLRSSPAFAGRFYKALAIYLADRLRDTTMRQKTGGQIKIDAIEEDELDETVLDGVSIAGLRFQQMLKTLMGAGNQAE